MYVNVPEGVTIERKLAQPFRDLKERGITTTNWLDHLDEMSDSEITEVMNVVVGQKELKILNEERAARPSISDRQRAYGMRDFGA